MAGYIGSKAVSLSTTAANVEGNITVTGNVDGRDVSVDGTKLDTIPVISTSSVPSFTAKSDGTTDGYIQLNCSANSHGIKLKSPPHSAGASYTLVFPVNDGDSGQFLRTDGSGVLSWGTDATLDNTKLPLAGGAMTGNVTYGDNNKIILGASSDLNIYHDSTQGANVIGGSTSSNLTITSGGNLSLGIAQAELLMVGTVATLSGNTQVKLSSGVVTTLTGTGGVTLDNNGNPKFSTTNTGVAVTGNITVTGTVDSIDIATRDAVLTSTTTTANAALPKAGGAMTGAITTNSTFDGRDVAADGVLATNALPKSGGTITGLLTSGTDVGLNSEYLKLGDDTSNRQLKLTQYQTGGANNNAGHKINASSGYGELALAVGGTNRLVATATGVNVTGEIAAATGDFSGAVDIAGQSTVTGGAASAPSYSFTGDTDTGISRPTTNAVNIVTAGTERMRIDSSGNVLVGKGATDSGTNGIELNPNGFVYITANNTLPLYINRRGTGGLNEFVRFADDGATIGKIVGNGGRLNVFSDNGSSGGGIRLDSAIRPTDRAGAVTNGANDLGAAAQQWRDLYLSGGVVFGPASGSNVSSQTLDSYETGTWTPVVAGSSTAGSVSFSSRTAFYTKIGRFVHIDCVLDYTISGEAGTLTISGMPFQTAAEAVGSFQCNNMELAYQSNVGQYTPRVADNATAFTFRGTTTNGGDFAHMVAQSMSFLRVAIQYQTD